jgi:hypothetical protein
MTDVHAEQRVQLQAKRQQNNRLNGLNDRLLERRERMYVKLDNLNKVVIRCHAWYPDLAKRMLNEFPGHLDQGRPTTQDVSTSTFDLVDDKPSTVEAQTTAAKSDDDICLKCRSLRDEYEELTEEHMVLKEMYDSMGEHKEHLERQLNFAHEAMGSSNGAASYKENNPTPVKPVGDDEPSPSSDDSDSSGSLWSHTDHVMKLISKERRAAAAADSSCSSKETKQISP